ncbi:hypothetical protein HanPI659440_Chr06g0220871 [Helianthus annuus]|nr:hypothetical protein HanPI659440_Chr06g0220871 [Helianthus annuus]
MKPKTHTYLCAWDRTEQRKTRVKPLFAKFNQLEGNFKGVKEEGSNTKKTGDSQDRGTLVYTTFIYL